MQPYSERRADEENLSLAEAFKSLRHGSGADRLSQSQKPPRRNHSEGKTTEELIQIRK